MKAVRSKSVYKMSPSQQVPYRFEMYLAWLIIFTLFLAIASELFAWTVVIEGAATCIALGSAAVYFHRFYHENQKLYKKEQRAKDRLIAEIGEQYPSLTPFKKTLNEIVEEQLAAQSCSQKRLALLSYYRHNQAAVTELTQQLRAREAQNRVMDELGLQWPQPPKNPTHRSKHK